MAIQPGSVCAVPGASYIMSMDIASPKAGDRAKVAVAVILLHGLIGYALIVGLGVHVPKMASEAIAVFDVPPVPPPKVEKSVPKSEHAKRPEGTAAPANIRARATPIVTPLPIMRLPIPSPVIATLQPSEGIASSSGASTKPGPGTGEGGAGSGTGSGGAGDSDGGGEDSPPRHIKGSIKDSDFPADAAETGIEGTVSVRYAVETDGRATHCAVTRSSGHSELDAATCRIIESRFRYDPSRDADGVPVRSTIVENHSWFLDERSSPRQR